ncbi:MAG TPA: FAD:protein FMN transferase [Caldisericia bacterium]|nr:FAD:protein FMN transferase [Caldisericia bacterium]HOL82436.1 FAD:protein FMN transferase [Caldisericia bacterium]
MWRRFKYSRLIIFFLTLILIFSTSCKNNLYTTKGLYMGTFLIVSIDNEHKNVINKINEEIIRIEEKFSRFKEESLVYKINNEKGSWIDVDDEFLYVLKTSLYLNKISNGAFNPLIGDIVNEYGFYDGNYKVPDENTLKGLLKNIDIKNIEIDEKNKKIKIENGSLDFGGIVKGYAVDKIREILIENSVKESVINLGGNILVWGDRKFKIGVKNPRGDGIIYTFELNGNSTVSTSGDYENFFIKDNKRYHHIINPEDGKPAESGLIEVSIVSESGIIGDGLSTTLFILGKEKGKELIKNNFPNTTVLFVDEELNMELIK